MGAIIKTGIHLYMLVYFSFFVLRSLYSFLSSNVRVISSTTEQQTRDDFRSRISSRRNISWSGVWLVSGAAKQKRATISPGHGMHRQIDKNREGQKILMIQGR